MKHPDPAFAVVDSLTTDQVLELLGPSWSAMSAAERRAHGPSPAEPIPRARGTTYMLVPVR
jgi:hypothetical protein